MSVVKFRLLSLNERHSHTKRFEAYFLMKEIRRGSFGRYYKPWGGFFKFWLRDFESSALFAKLREQGRKPLSIGGFVVITAGVDAGKKMEVANLLRDGAIAVFGSMGQKVFYSAKEYRRVKVNQADKAIFSSHSEYEYEQVLVESSCKPESEQKGEVIEIVKVSREERLFLEACCRDDMEDFNRCAFLAQLLKRHGGLYGYSTL